jgi:hypothetical protein
MYPCGDVRYDAVIKCPLVAAAIWPCPASDCRARSPSPLWRAAAAMVKKTPKIGHQPTRDPCESQPALYVAPACCDTRPKHTEQPSAPPCQFPLESPRQSAKSARIDTSSVPKFKPSLSLPLLLHSPVATSFDLPSAAIGSLTATSNTPPPADIRRCGRTTYLWNRPRDRSLTRNPFTFHIERHVLAVLDVAREAPQTHGGRSPASPHPRCSPLPPGRTAMTCRPARRARETGVPLKWLRLGPTTSASLSPHTSPGRPAIHTSRTSRICSTTPPLSSSKEPSPKTS